MSSLPAGLFNRVHDLKNRQEPKPSILTEIKLIVTGLCAAWQPKSEHETLEQTDSFMKY